MLGFKCYPKTSYQHVMEFPQETTFHIINRGVCDGRITLFFHGKIDNDSFGRYFGCVVWITEFCGYVKLEVRIEVDLFVTEFDNHSVPLLDQ